MKKLTRNNIAYDFNISPHIEVIRYGDREVEYVFSSDLYRRKFLERRKETRTSIEEFMLKKYDVNIEMEELSDFYLYKKIEKRGFLIRMNDKEALWPEEVNFGNNKMTFKSFAE